MAWIRVDDAFDEHPKMLEAGPLGWALWLAGLAYSNRNLTDGFIPWSAARKLVSWDFLGPRDDNPRGRKVMTISVSCGMVGDDVTSDYVIGLLLDAGLWEEVDGGFYIHDYPEYQPLRSDIERKRELKTERQRRWRENRDASNNDVVDAHVDASTDAHVDASRDAASQTQSQYPKPKSEEGNKIALASQSRRQDLLFEIVSECWLGQPYQDLTLTKAQRGAVNACVTQLRQIDADPSEVPREWSLLRERFDNPTPAALAKHWRTHGTGPRTHNGKGPTLLDGAEQRIIRREQSRRADYDVGDYDDRPALHAGK